MLLKVEPCLFPSLSILDVSYNQIHDQGFKELAVALLKIKTLTVCILDGNQLSYAGFQDFLQIIRSHPRLERLSLRENRICEVDKEELDRHIGILLREQEHTLQHIDVTGNYLMSKGHDPNRLATLRLLLRATGLSVEEFSRAEWVREKDCKRAHHTVLRLSIDDVERDFEVALSVMDAFNAYRTAQNLGSDKRVIEDLQSGLTHNLRRHPALKPVRLSTMDAKAVKEQKQLCKQMLFYHPKAPLKAYLKSHPELRTERLPQTTCLLCPDQSVTPQEWRVYFLADRRQEHALLAWEGVYSYGQRVLKAAHLTFKVIRTPGLLGQIMPTKQLVISYHPKAEIATIESFRSEYEFAVFSVPKKAVKAMEVRVDRDLGNMPGKYKAILSSGSGSSALSPEDRQKVVTNCQKWVLEKLEECLDLASQTLLAKMSPLPSRTVKVLQRLPRSVTGEDPSLPDEEVADVEDVEIDDEKGGCLIM